MRTAKPLSIATEQGLCLAAVVHHPVRHPRLCAIVAHGMLSSKESLKHQRICGSLAEDGVLALRFDFRGRGDSEGDPALVTVSNEVADLKAVAAWLQRQTATPLVLVGSSLGAAVSLLVAPSLTNLAGLVTVACPARLPATTVPGRGFDNPRGSQEKIRVGPGTFLDAEFFVDARRHDPVAAARTITLPWLILHGDDDELVPVDDAHELARVCPSSRLLTLAGCDHRFSDQLQLQWLLSRIREFVGTLGASGAPG